MRKFCLPFLMVLCSLLFTSRVNAQSSADDAQLQRLTTNVVTAYQNDIGVQSRLYRGHAYDFYDLGSVNEPYFLDTAAFKIGRVKYDGIVYNNIPLLYDEYKQVVVTFLYDYQSKFALLSNIVSEFDIKNHHFIRFGPDAQNPKMDVAFYDELYNNKLQVLVKRERSRQEEGLSACTVFPTKTTYYLKKNGIYHTINTKGQFIDVLGDKKKELKKYIKENNIDFSENRDKALVLVTAYYNQISN